MEGPTSADLQRHYKIELRQAELKIKRLSEALMDVTAHLVGAASAYRQYARRYKVRGPSDPFFTTRADDFDKAAARGREVCKTLPERSK